MKFIYKNTSIFYSLKGQGPVVVFIHGFLEDSTMWEPILASCTGMQTLVIDLPGHGRSKNFDDLYTMDQMALVVIALLDILEIKSATVVGHSMGGYIALAMAQNHPNYLEKLILVNSTPLPDSPERLKSRKQAIVLLGQIPARFTAMAIKSLFDKDQIDSLLPTINKLQQNAAKLDPKGIIAAVKGMMARPDRTAILEQLTLPKVFIASLKDPIIDASQMAAISTKAGAQFVLLPGGHMSSYEQPEKLKQVLLHFIK
ncbi:MAG: alpha/beta hydrolase [Gilvibacter sp.]